MSEHRINARLNEATGQSISGVVREAIAPHHATVCNAKLAASHPAPKKTR